jgi:hypothetical protein
MSQEFDSPMQQAPAAAPVAPVAQTLADAWRHLASIVSVANGAHPEPSSRPIIPAGTPPEFAGHINRAYSRGSMAYREPSLGIEPPIPNDAGTPRAAVALWEFYWQGYRYAESVANVHRSISNSDKSPKVAKPETYSGERDKYSDFIAQLHLVFNTDKAAFRDDIAKISYTGNLLRGPAKKWFTPHVNEETGAVAFSSWAHFIRRFRSSFQDSDAKTTAERKLLNMKQGTEPCASYHARFVSYMAILDWDEKSQIATFRRGLRSEVKDLLVGRDIPDSFDEYVSLCIRLDNSWREREQDKKDSGVTRVSTKADSDANSTAVGTHSGPMDISAGRRGPLSKQERNHRKANNLCMYCGQSGHFASTCPESSRNNNKGKQPVNAAIATSPAPATPAATPAPSPAAPKVSPNASVLYSTAAQ